jgi:hypothetical protein
MVIRLINLVLEIINKIIGWFDPDRKRQKIRNEIERLEKEKNFLLAQPCTPKLSDRMVVIEWLLDYWQGRLKQLA